MNKVHQWLRTGLTLGISAALFACSSKGHKDDAVFQPTSDAASETPTAETIPAPPSDLRLVHFAFDSAKLSRESRKVLKADATWMRKNPEVQIEIQGHCDERGTTEHNRKLGEKRAKAVRRYLVHLGVKASRLTVISYGAEQPVIPGHDETAWAQNRRALPVVKNQSLSQAE